MYSIRDDQYTHYFELVDGEVVYKHTIDKKYSEQVTTNLPAEVLADVRSEFSVECIANINHVPNRR